MEALMHFWLETLGYLGSLLVAISLMMRSLLRLRLINLAGALTFVLYGLLIRAYPVAFMNALIVGIDVYYLLQMWRQREYFTFLEVAPDDRYLGHFLAFHAEEIQRFQPGFTYAPDDNLMVFFVLRNMIPAGLFIARRRPDAPETAVVLLDFVIPGYRDLRIGRYVYQENARYFQTRGIQRLVSSPGTTDHSQYLEKMGYTPQAGNCYSLSLSSI